jgi:thiamine-phosphate pyrophosphorylase
MASSARAARLRGLYALTPGTSDTALLAAKVRACLEGGAAMVQYRAKNAPPDLAVEQARLLLALCRAHAVPLIVNDSVALAAAIGADGVHLGRGDDDAAQARLALPRAIIGVSCYDDPQRARAAASAGADYVAIGSVFASSTKPCAARAPLDRLAAAGELSRLPVAAIGGITAANAPEAIAAGADMVAVIAALFDAVDVAGAARSFARLFEDEPMGGNDVRTQPRAL